MRFPFYHLKSLISERNPLRLSWHFSKAFIAAAIYGFPARKLTVIAITGTDGKTTTVEMVAHILRFAGRKVGAASTAAFSVDEAVEKNATQKTSMSPFLLQRFLRRLIKEKCEFAVIETSSHGLVQGRVHHTYPKVAAITNTSPEHLDYHGTIEQYRKDKGKLFAMLHGGGTKILNGSDGSYELYHQIPSAETIVYNTPNSDLWISAPGTDAASSSATLHTELGGEALLQIGVPGTFNLENALCAIGCAEAVGIPLTMCIRALENYHGAPGRLERIDEGQPFSVFVDFTVTPVAYRKTLQTLRAMVGDSGRVLVLCGSCGDRMKEKRPEVGRIVSELADIMVVSNEDPYTEDPQKIIEEVWLGVNQESVEAHKIADRRQGIEFLLKSARQGDAVIFCAKGADTTMWVTEGQIPWDERAIVREVLREMFSSSHTSC